MEQLALTASTLIGRILGEGSSHRATRRTPPVKQRFILRKYLLLVPAMSERRIWNHKQTSKLVILTSLIKEVKGGKSKETSAYCQN